MSFTSVGRAMFPRPRRQLTWRSAWPLFVFLIAYTVLVLALEWSGRVAFAKPVAFSLMVATLWVWWMHAAGHAGLGRTRSLIALFVRLSLAGLFAMLLAEPIPRGGCHRPVAARISLRSGREC